MSNSFYYQKSSLKEVINHGVESIICFGTSVAFLGIQHISSQSTHKIPIIKTGGAFFGHLGYLFLKDAIVESLAALGHYHLYNQAGERAVTFTNYQENNSSIAHQEAYNQFVEGTNKVAPIILHSIFAQPLYDTETIGKINLPMELVTSYGRSAIYSLKAQQSISLQYLTTGHFANEFELHTQIEAPFLLALITLPVTTDNIFVDISPIKMILMDEFFLEFFKGLSFGAVNLLCPSCSDTLEKFREHFVEQNTPTPEQCVEAEIL